MRSGYDEYVGITRFTMNIIGIWPGDEFTKITCYSSVLFLIPTFFILFFTIIPQTRQLLNVWGDLNMILEILTKADLMVGLALVKLLGIVYSKKDLRLYLIELSIDWKTTTETEQQAMWKNVKLCKILLTTYATLSYGVIASYATDKLILLFTFMTEENQLNISRNKPMFVISDFGFQTETSPTFEIIWICQLISATYSVTAFIAFDGFFVLAVLHLCSKLTNLQIQLRQLNLCCGSEKKFDFVMSLRLIVRKHLQIKRLAEIIENSFNMVFLIHMIVYSISLCLLGYQSVMILTGDDEIDVAVLCFIVIFASANMTSLSMYCFVAVRLQTESTNLFLEICELNWYELQPKESRMLINMMHMTEKPLEITAGKFTSLSYELLTKVLKTACGYLSMLLAVKGKD